MIKNLIWDLDGTLFDTYPAIVQSYLEAMRALGHTVAAAELDAWARISLGLCTANLAARCDLDKELLGDRFAGIYRTKPIRDQALFPGVRETCEAVVAAGGTNTIVTHRARESTECFLQVHGLAHLFTGIAAGDEGFAKKPDPAAFLAILARCALDPAETATVGDREIDILAGKAAGVATCWYQGRPADVQPDLLFTDYGDLLRWLGLNPATI